MGILSNSIRRGSWLYRSEFHQLKDQPTKQHEYRGGRSRNFGRLFCWTGSNHVPLLLLRQWRRGWHLQRPVQCQRLHVVFQRPDVPKKHHLVVRLYHNSDQKLLLILLRGLRFPLLHRDLHLLLLDGRLQRRKRGDPWPGNSCRLRPRRHCGLLLKCLGISPCHRFHGSCWNEVHLSGFALWAQNKTKLCQFRIRKQLQESITLPCASVYL